MSILTRDQITAAQDLATETVAVPEWGGDVLVRALDGRERDLYEASLSRQVNGKWVPNTIDSTARLAALAIVDEQGNRLFSDNDVKALTRKSGGALARVNKVAARLAGLSTDDSAVKDAEGNSELDPSDAGTSSAPERPVSPSVSG